MVVSFSSLQHDEERETSEREVIEATRSMINERIPALAAELDAIDTVSFSDIYERNSKSPS